MYNKLAGMTGTAKTEEEEFRNIYNMTVTQIPTNKPVQRNDKSDLIYISQKGKFDAVVEDVVEKHKAGQPVLLGTVAVETSEYISNLLKKRGIRHDVLDIGRIMNVKLKLLQALDKKVPLLLPLTWLVVVQISN